MTTPRNHLALVARQRGAALMHDRRAPRGGQRNEMADLLAEYEDERPEEETEREPE